MYYSPTQQDIGILKQTVKQVFIKIELLNKQWKTLDVIHGNLISDNLNVDSESRQRRSYSCELHVTHASGTSFLTGNLTENLTENIDKKIWIDKYIRVHYGITDNRTQDTHWWLIGTFTYCNVSYTFSETEQKLSLSCADLMADFDGTKNGQMSGYALTIPAGEDIRTSIIATLKAAHIENYMVEDIGKEIPYDLEFCGTVTYCDIWTKICELYDSWEFFFDIDGTFIWRRIPTGLSEPVIFDDNLIHDIWISESTEESFSGIYNVTEVWGKVLNLERDDRYAASSTYSDGVYGISLDGITSLDDLDHLEQIAITICSVNENGAKISINGLEPIPIVNDDGTAVTAGRMNSGTDYVFSFRRNMGGSLQNCLYLLGQYQAYGIYKEMNPDCPFSVPNLGYEIWNRVDYENLGSDDLCFNQAQYLTYQTCAMMDTITLNLLLIPWLDVNEKISYTSKLTGETNQYIIKNFSWSTFDGTMSMTLYRFRESFSYVYAKSQR